MFCKAIRLMLAATTTSLIFLAAIAADAHDPHQHMPHRGAGGSPIPADPHAPQHAMQGAPGDDAADVHVFLSDASVVTSTGKRVRFRSDVVGGAAVAINFIYTSCTTICPPLSGIFENVQSALADRLGRDVRLITVSIDPAVDSPARMAAMASKFQAQAGWLWVTGAKDAVEEVLKGLNTYTPDIDSHPPIVLIGSATEESWTRLYGFSDPEEIAARVIAAADRMAGRQNQVDRGGR